MASLSALRRITLLGTLALLPLLVSGCALLNRKPTAAPVTLEFWGVFDDAEKLGPFIKEFEAINPTITVHYTRRGVDTYETDVINEFAAGRGPDVWMIHNTWLPKHQDKIAAFPQSELSTATYQQVFADVASADLTSGGLVYAVPTSIDTLGLLANRDILQSAGIATLPTTWEEFNAAVKKVTRYDSIGNLTRSGAAIGTAKNINRASDILSALMLQTGVTMTAPDKKTAAWAAEDNDRRNRGVEALTFYTNFSLPNKAVYTWDLSQDQSIDAFVAGKTALLLNYSFTLGVIKERAPRLNIGVAGLPQLVANGSKVAYANYWPLAVSRESKHQTEARKFIQFLASNSATAALTKNGVDLGKEVNKRYLAAFRRPAGRRDLITEQQSTDVELGPLASQALVARSWYVVDDTTYEAIFHDVIDDVILGRETVLSSLTKAQERYTRVLQDTVANRTRAGLSTTP